MSPKKIPLTPAAQSEIDRFRREIKLLNAGKLDETDFKRFRLNNGVYGIRGSETTHMIRIKVPFGVFNADQMDAIADVSEKYTPTQILHVTTRQAIQLHNMKREDVPDLLLTLFESGLTTREACGNTVRNVSCDELAGVAEDEVFDPRPYADLVFRYFLRNPICQNLPRKFKIAFEGCPSSDRARTGIHDVGFRAKIEGGRKGFSVIVGGGLGSMPFAAKPLVDFMPVEDILPTVEAIVRLFDRHGDRRDRNRARLKFVVAKWGLEKFQETFLAERDVVRATSSGLREQFKIELPETEAAPRNTPGKILKDKVAGFDVWSKSNAWKQKQAGYHAVFVRCYLGDLDPTQARAVAQIARDFGGGRLRTTITQNVVLPWIKTEALQTVHARLAKVKLALAHALEVADITRCPGAETCNLAVTRSKGLARDLTERVFSNGHATDEVFKSIVIKISGCTNSCGQHHIADIGFYGGARNYDGKSIPHYQLLIGGRTGVQAEDTQFGKRVAQIPARRIHEAVKHILDVYKADRNGQETFAVWSDRRGIDYFKKEMAPYQSVDPLRGTPNFAADLDDDGHQFQVKVGKGECAA